MGVQGDALKADARAVHAPFTGARGVRALGLADLGEDFDPVAQIWHNNTMALVRRWGRTLGFAVAGGMVVLAGLVVATRRSRGVA